MKEDYDFDNINYDSLEDWCLEFAHWNFVQDELADVGEQSDMVDRMVRVCIVQLKEELDNLVK